MTPIYEIASYYFEDSQFKHKPHWHKIVKFGVLLLIGLVCLTYFPSSNSHTSVESAKHYFYDKEDSLLHDYIASVNNTHDAFDITRSIIKHSAAFEIDPKLVAAIAKVESNYDKFAISPAGAFGVMQVIPKWHLDKIKAAKVTLGTPEVFSIDTNIYLGVAVYKECFLKFGEVVKALRCYNGSNGLPTDYDTKVLAVYKTIQKVTSI